METLAKARRVRIYTSEDDRRSGKLLYRALVEFLRAENAQGATVFRALEGFGATGQLHVSSLVDVAARLPVIVEWIDLPEQVERLMPRVLAIVQHGLVTVDETDILLFEPHPVRDLKPTATVATVMSRDVAAVEPTTPERATEQHARARTAQDLMVPTVATALESASLAEAIAIMLPGSEKVLAVTDASGRVVGVVDRADLLHGLVQHRTEG
ncbi:MAG TPA: DUF190 domain-containing protein [Anaeromyxobacteraceae bacterium]|nr:DUF190 domain-containing protein [Anaeromyxobacteraceae bacterium]